MCNECNCQPYEVDYKKVVQEIQEALYHRSEQLEKQLKKEYNPIRYIENKAILNDVEHLRNTIYDIIDYCKKPIKQEVQEVDHKCECCGKQLQPDEVKVDTCGECINEFSDFLGGSDKGEN